MSDDSSVSGCFIFILSVGASESKGGACENGDGMLLSTPSSFSQHPLGLS